MKYNYVIFLALICLTAQGVFANEDECLCIKSEAVKKYSDKEFSSLVKNEIKLNQEKIAKRDIQSLQNESLEAGEAMDVVARDFNLTEDFTLKNLEGKIFTRVDLKTDNEGSGARLEGIIKVSDKSWIKIEALTLQGAEAILYTNQHFVRYMPDRKDGSPHEVITNIIHREIWVFNEQGWKLKHIEELERGKSYLNGTLFDIG